MGPHFEERRLADGHVLLTCHDPFAAEGPSEETFRAAARRLGSVTLIVAMPRPGALYVSTAHPVAIAGLESLAQADYDGVARNGGPTLSRGLQLVVDGRLQGAFVPGTLAARRAVGVVTRPVAAGEPTEGRGAPAEGTAGFFAWVRRLTGG